MSIISQELIYAIRNEYVLDWRGIHGISHFQRVREIGLRLAKQTGAKANLVELFAFLHDAKRRNDHVDPKHGARAARFARHLRGSIFFLSDHECEILDYACRFHTKGLTEADVTVQVCWDSDRLDLGRAGIRPKAKYLCTPQAQDPKFIARAYRRSVFNVVA